MLFVAAYVYVIKEREPLDNDTASWRFWKHCAAIGISVFDVYFPTYISDLT